MQLITLKTPAINFRLLYASMFIFLTGLLSACGGGGGGSSTPAAATVDPTSGETAVERNAVVTATFTNDVDDATVNGTSFTLGDSGGNPVSGVVSLDAMNNIATFTPDDNLGVLRTYTASLSASITHSGGTAITAMNWSFTTRDGVWAGAGTIETDDIASSYPKIAFGPGGDAAAVWINNSNVFANLYDAATDSWGTATQINTDGGISDLQVAMDNNGEAIAVWARWDGAVNNIRAARYNGMAWEADVPLEVSADDARYPKIAIDGSGDAVVVWLQASNAVNSIWVNHYDNGGAGWGVADLLESTDGEAFAPDIAVDDGGDAIAVWVQDNQSGSGPYNAVYASYYTAGGSWVNQGEIGENSGAGEDASKVSIAQDGDGNAIAIWHQLVPGLASTSVWVNRYTGGNGGSWGSPAVALDTSVNTATQPQVAFDSTGNAMAVWGRGSRVRAARYAFNSGWGTVTDVDAAINPTSFPRMAFDREGHAIVVWREDSNAVASIWANRYQSGAGWGTPQVLESDDTNIVSYSDIAIDTDGNAFAIWAQIDPLATQNKIWVNRFE